MTFRYEAMSVGLSRSKCNKKMRGRYDFIYIYTYTQHLICLLFNVISF